MKTTAMICATGLLLGCAGCSATSGTTPAAAGQALAEGKALCVDLQTGLAVAATTAPSLVAHNADAIGDATRACAAINAVPVIATVPAVQAVPVTAPTHVPLD